MFSIDVLELHTNITLGKLRNTEVDNLIIKLSSDSNS